MEDLNTTTPNNTQNLTICRDSTEQERLFVNLSLLPSLIIVILISFFQRRKQLWPNCCNKRPAVAYPVNFVDEHERRWAYAAVFGIMSFKVLLLFDGDYYYRPPEFDDPEWMKKYGFCTVFVQILNVIQIGIIYYPLCACVALRRNIISNIVGFLYAVLWFCISMISVISCIETNVLLLDSHDYWDPQSILNLVFYAPIFVCYLILLGCFLLDLYLNVKKIMRKRSKAGEILTSNTTPKDTTAHLYVRALLKRRAATKDGNFVSKIKQKVIYENIPGLKYSPRVLCTMVVAGFAILKFGIELAFWLDAVMLFFLRVLDTYGPAVIGVVDNNSTESLFDQIREGITITRVSLIVCNVLSMVTHIAFMVLMVLSYRTHLRKYIQGHRAWHFKNKNSPASNLVGSMRYSGYQIAFLIYGWLILFLVLLLIVLLFAFLIAVPLHHGRTSFVIEKIKSLWPTVLISMIILVAQRLLAKFVFLQDKGEYMALNNRRWYHVLSFFLFFFNILLGLFSALKRILLSMVAGIIFLSRLDKVLMMRGFERFDSGFTSYLGMLETEVYHTHPILRCFLECLSQSAHARKHDLSQATDDEDLAEREKRHKRRVLANKWFKAITLINNPSILIERLHRLIKEQENENKKVDPCITKALVRTQSISLGSINKSRSDVTNGDVIPEKDVKDTKTEEEQKLKEDDEESNLNSSPTVRLRGIANTYMTDETETKV